MVHKKSPSFVDSSYAAQKGVEPRQSGLLESFNAVRKNKYLVLMTIIIATTVIVSTFIDWHFSSVLEDHFVYNMAKIPAFLGLFYCCIYIVAFFLNIFFTSYSLKNLSIRLTLLFTPIALLAGSVVVLIFPPLLMPAIAIKGTDEGLGFSLQQSVREFLYIPVSSELKSKSKPFMDIFIKRFATVVASILLLLFALSLEKKVEYLTPIHDPGLGQNLLWLVIGCLILWIVLSLRVPKEYVNIIRNNIKILRPRADKIVSEKLDVDYARLVFDTVESKDQSSVLYALQLFDLLEQDKLTPEIREMISQKADEEKASSLGDLFSAEGAMWFPEIADDIDQEAFITDIREIMSSENYQQLMDSYAERVIEEGHESVIEKMELAKMIGLMDPKSQVVGKLESLINDTSVEVARYAIQSAARLKREEYIPDIIDKLSNPLIHEDAVIALKLFGRQALNIFQKDLQDRSKALSVKQDVVKVLGQIGTNEAASILFSQLESGIEELDTSIIDALDRIRAEKTNIHFSPKSVQRNAFSVIKKYCQDTLDLMSLQSDEQDSAEGQRLQKRQAKKFAQIFKLLGLLYPHDDIVKAFQNIQTGTKDSVAYAIELLDNILSKQIKNIVLPLIEDLPPSERRRELQKILKNL
jgi:HEAT repeat protein